VEMAVQAQAAAAAEREPLAVLGVMVALASS